MNILDFLVSLRHQDIKLFLEGDRLRYTAPPEVITDELKQQLDTYQSELIALLHWQEAVSGIAPLELPTDYPRSAQPTYREQRHERRLPQDLTQAIQHLSQQTGAPLFVCLLSAFTVLLSRLSGQDEVGVGVSGMMGDRPTPTTSTDFSVNATILRTRLDNAPSFRRVLEQVQSQILAIRNFPPVPLTAWVEALYPKRNLNPHPICQVGFSQLNGVCPSFARAVGEVRHTHKTELHPCSGTESPGELAALNFEQPLEQSNSHCDLMLYVAWDADDLWIHLVSNATLFSAERMEEVLAQYEGLLAQLVQNPDGAIADYSLVTPHAQTLLPDPSAVLPEPEQTPVPALVQQWAQDSPQQVAICQGDITWTYEDLVHSATTIAQHLIRQGVQPGETVAVTGDRSFGLIASMLGVFLSGGVLLTLDPTLPIARQQTMLSVAQASLLLVVGRLQAPQVESSMQCLRVAPDTGMVEGATPDIADLPLPVISSNQAAYIFFTSGTTGTPKGVLGVHKGLAHFLQWQRQTFEIGRGDRIAQRTGLSFDVVLRDIFLPLISGATLCLPRPDDEETPIRFLSWLDQQQIAVLHLVPTLAKTWLMETTEGISLQSLRWIFFAGEPLSAQLVEQWRSAFPDAGTLVNLYGPTETTLAKCYYPVDVLPLPGIQPVGRPLPQTQALVLSPTHQLCGIGEIGEIVFRTPFRTLGYIKALEEQQQKFVPNPFREDAGDLLYYTGDLGRYRPDGLLDILGRRDHQVKIRGIRIELGEIEATLSRHPSVKQCVVIAREDQPGDKRLVAYVVPQGDHAHPREWRQFLQQTLMDSMVPSVFIPLDAIPLTPNGKIDRRALPQPQASDWASTNYVAPRTPLEAQLAEIWAALLGVERISVTDDFFELGGHSLLATQAVSRIRQALGVELPLRYLMEFPTIAELAEQIPLLETAPVEPILPASRSEALPLTFAQQRLWFMDELEGASGLYNISEAFSIAGSLDIPALKAALRHLVHRHENLRTIFTSQNGTPCQTIIAPETLAIDLSIVDLQALSSEQQQAEIVQLLDTALQQPFDLSQWPLFRVQLLRQGPTSHTLVITIHHIISDGWSMGVLYRKLWTLYQGYHQGNTPQWPPLPLQYADFAHWQVQHLQGTVLEEKLQFWRDYLANAPALLELPSDRPRPAVQTFQGQVERFQVGEDVTQALHHLGRTVGATPFMVALTAWAVLLSRYSQAQDMVIGVPIASRDRQELESLIGLFANTLALRLDLSGNPSFLELLQRVRQRVLDGYSHPDVPFEKLVEALNPTRTLSYHPLFQVMLNWKDRAVDVSPPELSITPLHGDQAMAKLDLTLAIEDTASGWAGLWEYNADLFDRATLQRMSGHYQTLLAGIVAHPERAIAELPLLTPTEQQQLLSLGQTQGFALDERCIPQQFEAQTERTPGAIALRWEAQSLSYRELNERANQLAHYLQAQGVGPEVLVGLCVERSLAMVVGLLGILKAGGAYVPVDPAYPPQRQAEIFEDAQVSLILTQESLITGLPSSATPMVCLDADWSAIAQYSAANPEASATPDNLAYVIYTSGSTGKPKGVMIEHRALSHFVQAAIAEYGITGGDRILQFASISFDAAVEEVYPILICGGQLVLRNEEMLRSAPAFFQTCEQWGITILDLPTAYWHQLADAVTQTDTPLPPDLRLIVIGGEAVRQTPVQRWQQKFGSLPQIVNSYGPTEATVVTTVYWIGATPVTAETPIPIGKPLPNVQVYVLDSQQRLVPRGLPGELYVGGAGVARGYLHRDDLTAERFIPNPFGQEGGDRLYRTGDLVRYNADGHLEFLGRIDHQVKLRGFRIELGEIETRLNQHPSIREAMVMVREDVPGNPQLVAYGITASESPSSQELQSFLKQTLPHYMVPAAFVWLEAFPLTPNGKVDRKALPQPDLSQRSSETVAPRTSTEALLCNVWSELLHVQPVGIHDNFFELGGHSLLATQIVSRIQQVLEVDLPLRSLMEFPTVAELAEHIPTLPTTRVNPILPVPRTEALPLSFAQQRLWFLNELEGASGLYNIAVASALEGSLDVPALTQALHHLVQRHESLRTTFKNVAGTPVQAIAPPETATLPFPVVDLQLLSAEQQAAEINYWIREETQHPFDMAQGPLVRVHLLKQGETSHTLLVTMHHIISDGWSMNLFFRELWSLYQVYHRGETPQLSPLPLRYADFAQWQTQWLQGTVLEEKLQFWCDHLAGAPALLELPSDRPRPAAQTFRGQVERFQIAPELTQELQQLGRSTGATPFMVALTAWAVLLSRYSQTQDVVIGTPIANRQRRELESIIGFFANTLALRLDLEGNLSFADLLQRVRHRVLDAYTHQDVPFDKLVEALNPERNLSYHPIFQVMFSWQDREAIAPPPDLTVTALEGDQVTAMFDLTLVLQDTDLGWSGLWEYNTDLFDSATLQRMSGHFQTLLAGIAQNPHQPISELPLLTSTERQQLLLGLNQTEMVFSVDRCIHHLFEEQVERTPEAIAVASETQSLTYTELNQRANQLAHYLQTQGVGPEVLVGLCVERSLDMVVGLLGILKAGGAYVPVDPAYPQQRQAEIFEDAQVSLVLTQEALLMGGLPCGTAPVVCLDADWGAIAQSPTTNPPSNATAENLAYVIYTSGSTGKPKGVMIEHRSLVNFVLGTIATYPLGSEDRMFQFYSISFDAAAAEIYPCLLSGAQLVLRNEEMLRSATAFLDACRQWNITVLDLPTAYWHQLADALTQMDVELPSSLRLMVMGGEAVRQAPVQRWQQRFGAVPRLLNSYGPTEATVAATVHWMGHESATSETSVPIGKPVPNLQVYVLDAQQQPVPIGVPGELYIGGIGVARGYLNRPDLTAEKFVVNPFCGQGGDCLYRTGDLVRYNADGHLEFLGRIDHQVKLRGFRIELGEIETRLSLHPTVGEVMVIVREDVPGNAQLVAYVVPTAQQQVAPQELQNFLQQTLPSYMVPSAFVGLEAFPLTPNGKVDRKALPQPELSDRGQDTAYIAPRTPLEQTLANIWASILGVESVGVEHNFFMLGGHSLMAAQVIARVQDALHIDLPLRRLFEFPTIAGLAGYIQQASSERQPIPRRTDTQSAPLSFAQQRVWYLEQLEPGGYAYHIGKTIRLRGPLHVEALRQALEAIAERHESLRTCFVAENGIPYQRIQSHRPFELTLLELPSHTAQEQDTALQQILVAEEQRPFDLSSDVMLRAVLVRLSEHDHVLQIVVHHIVSDGISMEILFQELQHLYEQFRNGQVSSLSALPIQYADFAEWQRQWFIGDVLEQYLAYWKDTLHDITPLELPTDYPRPAIQNYRGQTHTRTLPRPLTKSLKHLSQREGATLFMTLLAAFKLLLGRLAGQDDVVVGTPIAERDRPEIEPLIGFFINTVVLRTRLSDEPSFKALLERVRQTALGAYAHQEMPFEKLVEVLHPDRDLSRSPIFQVWFNLFNGEERPIQLVDLEVESLSLVEPASKFDIAFYIEEKSDELQIHLVSNADLFSAVRMETMLAQFDSLLQQIVAAPETPIHQFSLVTPEIRSVLPNPQETLLQDGGELIYQRFVQGCDRHPQRIALVDAHGSWTYETLNQRSNQLAHYLHHQGIQPEDVVAIYASRSASLVWAILGVLKAGATVVILDAAYPAVRLVEYGAIANPQALLVLETAGPVDEELLQSLAAHKCCLTLPAQTLPDALIHYPTHEPALVPQPEQRAYIAFTSGSTGKPKAIAGTHRPVSHFLNWYSRTFPFTAEDHFSLLSGLAHDPLWRDIFTPLSVGATLHVPSAETMEDPRQLIQWMQCADISVMHLTPAMGQLLREGADSVPQLPALRYACFGGDRLTHQHLEDLRTLSPQVICINGYGATETPQLAAYCVLSPEGMASEDRVRVPVGRGIEATQLLVVNRSLAMAGVGEVGEIYVRSPHLSEGYLDDSLTHERFVVNPFTQEPRDRCYRTGDYGRYLPDGQVELLGRMDQQVKIRGFRIELSEIESALGQHPLVQQNVVVAREDKPGSPYLVAYVVTSGEVSVGEWRQFLKRSLPDYMIPAHFVTLPSLPLTPNGKVDRRALPKPEAIAGTHAETYIAPRTPLEQQLAEIWATLLDLETVGVTDNFFDLGGHSLLATQVVSRIRQALDVDLPLRYLIEFPTIAQLAEQLPSLGAAAANPIMPVPRTENLPLSFAQQRLWFLAELEGVSAMYTMSWAFAIEGALDIPALKAALTHLVQRHEVLRTAFTRVDGTPVQAIAPPTDLSIDLPIIDLQPLPLDQQKTVIQDRVNEAANTVFDLAQAPLLRVQLLKWGAEHYGLLVAIHHIVFDGWSMDLFFQELWTLYLSYSQGEMPELAPLPLQYADYAHWQRQHLQGDVLEEKLQFWRDHLAGAPALLELPSDRPRPATQTFRGDIERLRISPDVTQELQQLGRSLGATPFMVVLAAWAVLLSRYCQVQDVVIGTPVANRDRQELEPIIGFFANTLALRLDLEGNPSFAELLQRIRQRVFEAYTHQDVPFDKVVEAINPERTLSYHPIFQVMLSWLDMPSDTNLPGLTINSLESDQVMAKFDVTLVLEDTGSEWAGLWEYNADLFDRATMQRMSGHFQTLLAGIATNPHQPISDLPLLTSTETQQLLVEWNQSEMVISGDRCIHQLFEEQAERTPGAIAVASETASLTYAELNQRANQLAHYLQAHGVGSEVLVGLCVERSLDMVVGLLGILKAGGAYVPVDPAYPARRQAEIFEDAQVSLVLTHESLLIGLPSGSAPIVCLDGDWPTIAQCSSANPVAHVTSKNLAYVIYTSGSTGKPKGVMIEHRSLVNFALGTIATYPLSSDDRMFQFYSISFDAAAAEIYPCLLSGAQLVLRTEEMLRSATAFLEACQQWNITVLDLPTAYWHSLADAVLQGNLELPRSLRLIVFGGEAVQPAVIERWQQQFASVPLLNSYGPTETTVAAAVHRMDGRSLPIQTSVPIGKPVPNLQVYVLDAQQQPVPVGVPGELYIGGAGVARGYLNRPDLTAEKFVANPFSDRGDRLYRTGDRVRYNTDGNLEFLGRIDHQVKLRGFRIELGEIEARLSQHPSVAEALVMVREDSPGNPQLVAYGVLTSQEAVSCQEIQGFLKQTLPGYMVPSTLVWLDAFPLTPNGKVDRKALPQPDWNQRSKEAVAPRTATEVLLCSIWSELLPVAAVGIHDNFFELGGHSLLATQVVSRMQQALGVDMPLRYLIEFPTIAELAAQVPTLEAATAQPILPVPRTETLPLSFPQQRLWFLHQLEGGSASYHVTLALRMDGGLQVEVLEAVLRELWQRHEGLRAYFPSPDGLPEQRIHAADGFELTQVDVPVEDVEQWLQTEAQRTFDLGSDRLLRASLLRCSPTTHVLVLVMHHIICDGWSMGILVQELSELYRAFTQGTPSPLPVLPIQYADFACWQRQWLTSDDYQRQLGFWTGLLKGAPPLLELPTDRPRPPVQSFRGDSLDFPLPPTLTTALNRLSQQQQSTLFMTLLAAFAILLSRYSRQDDVVIGTPIANRHRPETESLVGFLANTLALRIHLDQQPSFTELLTQVRQMALGAYAHQDLPFDRLVEVLAPKRTLSHNPLFQVMFALQNAPTSDALELPGLTLESLGIDRPTAKFDLSLSMAETETGLVGTWTYSTDLFDATTITNLAEHFQMLLEGIVTHPQHPITDLPLMPSPENPSTPSSSPAEDLYHLLQQQAIATPDAIALLGIERSPLTYRQLHDQLVLVQQSLRSLGINRQDRVAIVLPNGPEMGLAFLAIAACATSAPLNPGYRAREFDFYLSDLQAKALIIQAGMDSEARAVAAQLNIPIIELTPMLDGPAGCFTLAGTPAAPPIPPGEFAQADDVALILHTSGTTSRPKIVPLKQRNLCASARHIQTTLALTPTDRCLNIMPLFHIHGLIAALLSSLASGASVVCTPGFYAPHILDWLKDYQPTWYTAVPTMHQTILSRAQANPDLAAQAQLRFVRSSSASLAPQIMASLESTFGVPVIEAYGMTEAAHQMASNPLPPLARKPGSVGLPAGPKVAIMNEAGEFLPVGVVGEVVIQGPNVTDGYENNPNANATAYTHGWFRTGDEGYLDADGYLFLKGRIKEIINRGGEKISPREVDEVLLDHPAVQQAVAFALPHPQLGEEVAAAIVLAPGATASEAELQAFAAKHLADFKMPRRIIFLEEVPKGPTGKLQRIGLADKLGLTGEETQTPVAFVAPRTATEQALAAIWSNILKVESFSIHDSFFEAGGDSVLLAQVLNRIRSEFGVELSFLEFFQTPTLEAIAHHIEHLSESASQEAEIEPWPRSHPLPLSTAQQRLWFLDQLEPGNPAYNRPMALQLIGQLNHTVLEQSLNEIVRRHEILRMTFPAVDGVPLPAIAPELRLTVLETDVRSLSTPLDTLLQTAYQQPFDLATGPLLRAELWRQDDDRAVLLITWHHIISDAWSSGVFVKELSALYAAFLEGQPSPLPELPLQFIDVVAWQQQQLQGDRLQQQLHYWQQQLANAPALLDLPTDHRRPPVKTFRGDVHRFAFGSELTQQIKALSQRSHSTPFMTLLTTFAILLQRYSRQDDILIGSPTANRPTEASEALIGFFLNVLVLRLKLSANPSFETALAQTRQVVLDAYSHQQVPFEQLLETLRPDRSPSISPWFQVMLVMHNTPMESLQLPGLTLSPLAVDTTAAMYDLTLYIDEIEEGFQGTLEYNRDLFEVPTVQTMADQLKGLLAAIVQHPHLPIGEFPLPIATAVSPGPSPSHGSDDVNLEALLAELEGLSEAEAEALLQAEANSSP